jgi:hypothetical protein
MGVYGRKERRNGIHNARDTFRYRTVPYLTFHTAPLSFFFCVAGRGTCLSVDMHDTWYLAVQSYLPDHKGRKNDRFGWESIHSVLTWLMQHESVVCMYTTVARQYVRLE